MYFYFGFGFPAGERSAATMEPHNIDIRADPFTSHVRTLIYAETLCVLNIMDLVFCCRVALPPRLKESGEMMMPLPGRPDPEPGPTGLACLPAGWLTAHRSDRCSDDDGIPTRQCTLFTLYGPVASVVS